MSGGYARFFGGIDHEACEQRELAADAGIWTLSSTPNVKPECATADPVRGRPWKPTVHRTAPAGRTLSAICPWTPQHGGPQRYKATHGGTEKKRPA
jgi:hypothetical protein